MRRTRESLAFAIVAAVAGAQSQDATKAAQSNATLEVLVVGPDAKPVPGAVVSHLSHAEALAEWKRLGTAPQASDWWDFHERVGRRASTDAKGIARIERGAGAVSVNATAEGLFGSVDLAENANGPTTITLARDRSLAMQTLDAEGKPVPGVEVCLYRFFEGMEDPNLPTAIAWSSTTSGEKALATLRHAQTVFDGSPQAHFRAALAIPVREREYVVIDAKAPPESVRLTLPDTGSVVVEMVDAPMSWVHIRAVPKSGNGAFERGARSFWSPRAPMRSNFRSGRAVFPFVGVGVELQVEAQREGMLAPAQRTGPGPTVAGEQVVFRITGPDAPGGTTIPADRAVFLERARELAISNVRLSLQSPSAALVQVCFVPGDDAKVDNNSEITLRFQSQTLRTNGGHRAEQGQRAEWHFRFEVDRSTASQLSKALGVAIAQRGERPYRLDAEFKTERTVYPRDAAVAITLKLTNTGKIPVRWEPGGWQRGANRHGRFSFTIHRDGVLVPDISHTTSFGGMSQTATLACGESLEETAQLDSWAHFDMPGHYVVDAEYELHVNGTAWPFDVIDPCPFLLDQYVDKMVGQVEFDIQ